MTEPTFKYRREDFAALPVTLDHLTLHIDFLNPEVEVSNTLHMTARERLEQVTLDAKELAVLSVESLEAGQPDDAAGTVLAYRYLEEENRLVVDLSHAVEAGVPFRIRTVTRCVPSENVLEGIYQDITPDGAPQQYMSQCQQWGFQRIAPIFDDCRAKCTFTTTIEADARYTHLITNGNISRTRNPDGKPVPKPGDPSRQVITFENPIPMAPYLFLVCAGTWDTLVDSVTYPSGRSVRLEYLVPPGRIEGARIPMEILKQSVLWVRETQGYEYTNDTYRTICMNKSNFGGMENVGNTTIVTDAALIDEHTLDHGLLYAHAVIVHEFEHNQCGSETTMDTPFDVWLNEAYTVDVERRFIADVFDPVFVRLNQVDGIRNPLLGPLAIEDVGHAGRIVREGFNDPDELIDSVTYVKAAEVIRMLRLVVGAENFERSKALYFERYRNGNADTEQFFQCFEEVTGIDLSQFKTGWLYRRGYPRVTATTAYDPAAKAVRIELTQESDAEGGPFHIPIELALVDEDGNTVPGSRQVFHCKDRSATVSLPCAAEPAVVSLNRSYSFYGTMNHENATPDDLIRQGLLDTDTFNRVESMRRLTDRRRIALLHDPQHRIDEHWLTTYGTILEDAAVPSGIKSHFLRIDEQPLDRAYAVWYPELVVARETLLRAVNERLRDRVLSLYRSIDTFRPAESPKDGIQERILKHVLLETLSIEDSAESREIILDLYRGATTSSDKVAALVALNRSAAPERHEVLEQVYEQWHGHLSAYANYLRVIAVGTQPDVFAMIQRERDRKSFDVTNPTWSRSLFLPMAVNNKVLWTDQGIAWLTDRVIELAPVNVYVASKLLNAFQHAKKMRPYLRDAVTPAVERIMREVPDAVSPWLHRQAESYLA